MNPILSIKNCSLCFGGIQAIEDLNFSVKAGERIGVIGPNGAGKTSLFNLLTGIYSPTQGQIFFNQKEIKRLKPFEVNRLGIARTFQNIRLFRGLSIEDQLWIAAHRALSYSFFESLFFTKRLRKNEEEIRKKIFDLLDFFGLLDRRKSAAETLPYGLQRKLEIARALMTNPKLLLLDEPAAGMNATETKELIALIEQVQKEFNLTILLIEHDMRFVMNLCPRILVLNYGRKIAEGSPEELRQNPDVIKAYLGKE